MVAAGPTVQPTLRATAMPTIHRFFVPGPLELGVQPLPSLVARQVITVLRLRRGDQLVLFDGSGGEWRAELEGTGNHASVRLLAFDPRLDAEPALSVTLWLAFIRPERFEWALQKGTELGASAFGVLLTSRTTAGARRGAARAQGKDPAARRNAAPSEPGATEVSLGKSDRWRRIVVEATEQSGRTAVPALLPAASPEAILALPGAKVLCWEGSRAPFFDVAVQQAVAHNGPPLHILVGPEGGFTPQEAAAAQASGARLGSLGARILRSETAAITAVALAVLRPPPPE